VAAVGIRWPAGPAGNRGRLGNRPRAVIGVRATLTAGAVVLLSVLVGCGSGALTATATTATTGNTGTTATTGVTGGVSTTVPSTASGEISSPTNPNTAPRSTSTSQPVHQTGPTIELTIANDQQTVAAKVGQTVTLVLEDPVLQWTNVKVAPDGLLQPRPSPAPPPHGQRATWTAAKRATVAISAVGTPWCAAGTACPMFARLFKVTLIIS
jgi:hypothetical protein